jgi:hypothetical protein
MSTRLIDATTTSALKSANSQIERTCAVCHGSIRAGVGRYRIGEGEYHPDCFQSWLTPLPIGSRS